jgi:ATP-dependent Clp protease ATP-binding subunit ClpX
MVENGEKFNKSERIMPKPSEIKKLLDPYVIDQEKAKKVLSVAVYNHYKRIFTRIDMEHVEIEKSNILLIGPTGSGKTLLARTLAKVLKVPFTIADATTLTEAGYAGEDVENIILDLLLAGDYDVKSACQGIIYIDEIDKIARTSDFPFNPRDVSGEGVQQALLRIIEGAKVSIPPKWRRKPLQQDFVRMDTDNILFIFGGTFNGLQKIVMGRIREKLMGFGADIPGKQDDDVGEIMAKVLPEDLKAYGLIPEFVGRIPIITTLHDLNANALVRILTEPKNAILKQYAKLFELEGVELTFTDEALLAVAKGAIKRKCGARGLRGILEDAMLDIMYDIPCMPHVRECIIGEKVINLGQPPVLNLMISET